jgi:phospholipase C
VQIGPGFRVPAIVVSPWTAGGYVDSTLMDHTSLIRILERRFGVKEPHISAYRRKIMGDFTTSLQFHRGPAAFPAGNRQLQPRTVAEEFLAMQQQVANNPAPTVPTGAQTMPKQG